MPKLTRMQRFFLRQAFVYFTSAFLLFVVWEWPGNLSQTGALALLVIGLVINVVYGILAFTGHEFGDSESSTRTREQAADFLTLSVSFYLASIAPGVPVNWLRTVAFFGSMVLAALAILFSTRAFADGTLFDAPWEYWFHLGLSAAAVVLVWIVAFVTFHGPVPWLAVCVLGGFTGIVAWMAGVIMAGYWRRQSSGRPA